MTASKERRWSQIELTSQKLVPDKLVAKVDRTQLTVLSKEIQLPTS